MYRPMFTLRSKGSRRSRVIAVAVGRDERSFCAMVTTLWSRQASASPAAAAGTAAGPPPQPPHHLLPTGGPPPPSSSPAVQTATAESIVESLKEIIRAHGSEKKEESMRRVEERRELYCGNVLWYEESKRYGFIEPLETDVSSSLDHVFFHKSTTTEPVIAGDLVEYSLEDVTKAGFVRKIEAEPSSDEDVQFYRDFPDEYVWVEGVFPGKRPSAKTLARGGR